VNIPVVYEDKDLLVDNKPSGLLTVPTPKNELRTLTSILGFLPCHRLDRGTSGLIIYAKNKIARDKVVDLFRRRQVKKTYLAFVNGQLLRKEGLIQRAIEGKPAETFYRVIEQRNNFSIVEVAPHTGRTNQIRIHFKTIGHPLLGEDKYAFRRDFKIKAKRLCLHALAIEFRHPITGKHLKLEAALPQDLKDFLNKNV